MLQRGHSGDGCDLALTLCKYDLRKGDLFVLNWARVRRVRWISISSVLLMCGGGVHSILLLPLGARCLETKDVVVRLPRPMEGNGVTPIFRSLQNCQFHHRRLESLAHVCFYVCCNLCELLFLLCFIASWT